MAKGSGDVNKALVRFPLTPGENTYVNPAASSPNDARRLKSLIPASSGQLGREQRNAVFATGTLNGTVGFLHQFRRNVGNGVFVSHFFCATATTLYRLVNATWQAVTDVGMLASYPVAVNIDNLMHLSDGVSSWIFDGVNWVTDGLPIPLHAPTFTIVTPAGAVNIATIVRINGTVTVTFSGATQVDVGSHVTIASVSDTSFNGTFEVTIGGSSVTSFSFAQSGYSDASLGATGTWVFESFSVAANRYYWTTFVDNTTTRTAHESSRSPRSLGTGATTSKYVTVKPRKGTVTSTTDANIAGDGTDFSQDDVGKVLYASSAVPGTIFAVGTVYLVTDAQNLILSAPASAAIAAGTYILAPARATHWNVYASSSEEDKIGSLLASISLSGQGLCQYRDQSPFVGTTGSYLSNLQAPTINDPPNPTRIMSVHKQRIFRRDEALPNFFTLTAFEEVKATQVGSPYECVPGIDDNTVSADALDITSYPDESNQIRGLTSHGDALYIGTEDSVTPLYGEDTTNFAFSQVYAFRVGVAGRNAMISTPFGLLFLSYDRKLYLYPSQAVAASDATTSLIEMSRPKRDEFELIEGADLMNVHIVFYNWGRRNWAVICYQRTDHTYRTWAFNFETRGWFELQRGCSALAVFETAPGKKILVGADATTNIIYVLDDMTVQPPATTSSQATGTATISGVEQQVTTVGGAGDPGSGTVTIATGTDRSTTISGNTPTWDGHEYHDNPWSYTYYDYGIVTITVNGYMVTANYGSTSTETTIAADLATALNASLSPVTAVATGGVVTLTAKVGGTSTNYTLSTTSATTNSLYFVGTSFPATASGAHLTGGSGVSTITYDTGTVSLTINGFTASVSYGQTDTVSTIATALAAIFNVDPASFVTATPVAGVLSIVSRQSGAYTNYQMEASTSTDYPNLFAQPSFSVALSGDVLIGGTTAPSGNYPLGTYRQIVDFQSPNSYARIDRIEFEKSNADMGIVVTIWLDPDDPDSPRTGMELIPARNRIGTKNLMSYEIRPQISGGATCQRLLVEFVVSASTQDGYLRGVAVYGEMIPKPVAGAV